LKRGILGRFTEFIAGAGETITRSIRVISSRFSIWRRPAEDWARPDYAYWRRVYYGRALGLELSGLFVRPLVNKIAGWALGRAPDFKGQNDASTEALADWWAKNHPKIVSAYRAGLRQGDSFLVVNADLTLTPLPPDMVEPLVDNADYGKIIGWRVTQTLAHPQRSGDMMTIVDEYFLERRVHRVETNAVIVSSIEYPNLLGRLPIIHISNQADEGEQFGHAEAEALIVAFHKYGEVLDAAIAGNIRQGRPTPVLAFENKKDLDAFWADNGETETVTLADGTQETNNTLAVDLTEILTVSAATFDYKSPGSFAGDTEKLLGLLYYLILEHTELPEFVLGNAIASSKASADAQMPIFIRFIEMRRGEIAGWLVALAEVVLGYLSLTTPGVIAETPALQFEKLDGADGTLTLETIKWAFAEGLLDEATALMLCPLDIEDVAGVLAAARKEKELRIAQAAALAPQPIDNQPGGNNPPIDKELATEINRLEQ
jgi:hypothetical protein